MSMEDLFPPLVNKPNPMDDPAAPAFGRRGYVEPYEAEDDPDFSYDGFQVTRRKYYAQTTSLPFPSRTGGLVSMPSA